jgi:Ca-activated chloride channel family protein
MSTRVLRTANRPWPVAAWLLVAAAVPGAAAAQTVFRSGVDLVDFGVTVVDRRGQLVTTLTAEDFVVLEEGQRQRVQYFARGLEEADARPPLHLGLLFDTSGSMVEDLSFAQSAAIKFLNTVPQSEDMTLVDFDTEVRVARFTQRDFPRLVERLRSRKPDGWTALYDALGVYLDGATLDQGRKILVIYTDGGDTRSSTSFGDVMDLVRASDATIYAIGFLEHQSSSSRAEQRLRLQQLAEATGGQAFFPTSVKQLDEMYEKVLAEISAQYTLGYEPPQGRADGSWRKVEIRLANPDLKGAKIRTRKGYFAPFSEAAARQD